MRLCHDLRSGLRSIQPRAEMLTKTGQAGPAEEFQGHLDFLLAGTRQIDAILSGLAGYAIAMQIDTARFQNIPLDAVLRNALIKLEREHPGISARVRCGALPRVTGDADRLQQVFEVLIRNSMERSTGVDPRIEIDAEPDALSWMISIKNDAALLEAAELDRLFRPLERGSRRTTDDPGFAMATCRVIVERHGGRIRAEPIGRAGCAFRFTLPV